MNTFCIALCILMSWLNVDGDKPPFYVMSREIDYHIPPQAIWLKFANMSMLPGIPPVDMDIFEAITFHNIF